MCNSEEAQQTDSDPYPFDQAVEVREASRPSWFRREVNACRVFRVQHGQSPIAV